MRERERSAHRLFGPKQRSCWFVIEKTMVSLIWVSCLIYLADASGSSLGGEEWRQDEESALVQVKRHKEGVSAGVVQFEVKASQ